MIKIIGCGSLLMGDDGVGCIVARKLMEMDLPPEVKVIEAGTPGLKLLSIMGPDDDVIIVDAVVTGNPPGTFRFYSREELPAPESMPFSAHSISIPETIALGYKLEPEQMPRSIILAGIEVSVPVKNKRELSLAVASSVDKTTGCISDLVAEMLGR